jgi:hypothetical protein
MATAIFFGGRRINRPGAYSEIDATELATLAPGAVGIVALLGTAEGGKPLTVESEFSDATRPERLLQRYRSGDLRTTGQFCFEPSTDPAIPGGAQRLVNVKVNPATQSALQLADDNSDPAADLLSRDWGLFTEQISIEVQPGTTQGKHYTLTFENVTEDFDDVGADAVLDLLYTPGANGYTTMTGEVTLTQLIAAATKAAAGLDADITAQPIGPSVMSAVSDNAGDTTQTLTTYGTDATDAPVSETLSLTGLVAAVGTQVFKKVTGFLLSGATAGTVTVTDDDPATIYTIAPATLSGGLSILTNAPAAGVVTMAATADTANDAVVRGVDANGAALAERFDLTTALTTPVVGTGVFSRIDQIELGDTPAGVTVTASLNAASTTHATFDTTRKVSDRLNSLDGFTTNSLRTNTFRMVDLDSRPAATILSATVEFFADLYDFITAVNQGSQLLTATRVTGATLPPADTVGPLYLSGGTEGVPTITEWQTAFNLLKKRRVNVIVPLTRDPAVHALMASHLVYRAGKGRSEANGYAGIGTADGAGETKSSIKSQIRTLNTRHVSALSQECQRFDPDTGEATFYPPHTFAAIAGGMQAGSPVGEPLTFKRPFVTDIRQDSSWTVEDDDEELIDAGLMFAEQNDDVGIRFVRSVTTHLDDDNVVFTEMSANEAANHAIFELRSRLELKVGKRGLRGTPAVIKGLAQGVLEELLSDDIIVAFRSLTVDQIGDTFPVSVEMAPVLPINLIPTTVHLVAVRAAA